MGTDLRRVPKLQGSVLKTHNSQLKTHNSKLTTQNYTSPNYLDGSAATTIAWL